MGRASCRRSQKKGRAGHTEKKRYRYWKSHLEEKREGTRCLDTSPHRRSLKKIGNESEVSAKNGFVF